MYKSNIINFVNRNEIIDNLDEMNKLKKSGIYFITDPKAIVDSVSKLNETKTFHELKDNNLGRVLPKLNPMESYLFSYPFKINSNSKEIYNIGAQNLLFSVLYYDTNKRPHNGYNVDDVDYQSDGGIVDKSNNFFGFNNHLVQDEINTGLINNGYHQMNNDILEKIRNKDTSSLTGYEFNEKSNGFPSLLFGENFSSSFRLGEDLKYQGFLDYKTGAFAQDYFHQDMIDYGGGIMEYDYDNSMFYLNDGKWIPTKISFHNFARDMHTYYGYEKFPRFMNFPSYNYYPLMYNESAMTTVSDGRYKLDNEIFLSNPNVNFDTYKYFNNDMNYIPTPLAYDSTEENPNENKLSHNERTFGSDGKVKLRFTNEDKLGEDLFSKLGILEVIVTDNVIIQKYTNREYNLIRYFYENKWTNWKSNLPMVSSKDDINYPIGFGSHRNNYHTHALKGKLYCDDDILNLVDKVPRIKELNNVRSEASKFWLDKVKKEKINDVFIKRGDDEGIDLIKFNYNNLLFLNRNRDNKNVEDIAMEFKSLKETEFNSSGFYDHRFRGFMTYLPYSEPLKNANRQDYIYNTFNKPIGNVYGLDYRFTTNYINDKNFTLKDEQNLSLIRYGSNYINIYINTYMGEDGAAALHRTDSLSDFGYYDNHRYQDPNYITGTNKKEEAKKRGHDIFINGKNTNEYKRKYNNDLANFPEKEWLLYVKPSFRTPARKANRVLGSWVRNTNNLICLDFESNNAYSANYPAGFCLLRLQGGFSNPFDVYVDLSYGNVQDIRLYAFTNMYGEGGSISVSDLPYDENSIPFTLRVFIVYVDDRMGERMPNVSTTRTTTCKFPLIGFYVGECEDNSIRDYIDNMGEIKFVEASFYGYYPNSSFESVTDQDYNYRVEIHNYFKNITDLKIKDIINKLEEV